jgi:hypothetical protein
MWNPTKAGTPQGGIISPILANIYLHELDKYVLSEFGANQTSKQSHREQKARINPEWKKAGNRVQNLRAMLKGKRTLTRPREQVEEEIQRILKFRKTIPYATEPIKPRITYVRYADDFVIILRNLPKAEAERIKTTLTRWVTEKLHLVLSPEKTAITHINEGFNFLGYKIMAKKTDSSQPRVKLVIPYTSAQTKLSDIKEICRRLSTPETEVIRKLNDILRGWMIYYRCATTPSQVMNSVLSHTWYIYAAYVSRKNNCNIAKAAKRWSRRCPASTLNPKGGQKTWIAETINEKGERVKEYLICVPIPKRTLNYVARGIRLGISRSNRGKNKSTTS